MSRALVKRALRRYAASGRKLASKPAGGRSSSLSRAMQLVAFDGNDVLRKGEPPFGKSAAAVDSTARYRAPRHLTGCVVRLLDGRNVQVSNDGVLDFPKGRSASGDAHAPVHAALLAAGFAPMASEGAAVVTGGPGGAKAAAAASERGAALFHNLQRVVPPWAGRA